MMICVNNPTDQYEVLLGDGINTAKKWEWKKDINQK